ncbi:hypothetical protein [Streptomyces sp. NPDC007205]
MVETTLPQIRGNNPSTAEIIQKDGTRTFDGDALRLTPGREKKREPAPP